MNREKHLSETFPLKDGTTYIQSLDKVNEPKGAGVGGESIKENFLIVASSRIKAVLKEIFKGFKLAEENRHKSGFGKF
jgi:hypothetical protein